MEQQEIKAEATEPKKVPLVYPHYEGMEGLFQRIDANGGWPLGKNWITMRHDNDRTCYFSETQRHDGWNTSIYHADDYYLWKISDKGLSKITSRVAEELAARARDSIRTQVIGRSIVQPKYNGLHR